VVEAIVLPGEVGAARLRRQSRHVADASGDGRQQRSSSRVTAVAAPVRFELNTGSLTPTTVTSSAMAATFNVKSRSCATPRLSEMFSFTSVLNPVSAALTRYGPPTRMPGMKNRPSPRVIASYVVPDGWWTAVTTAPGITPPWASLTRPVIDAVVTPCALAWPDEQMNA